MKVLCSTENCKKPLYAKGLCRNCYARAWRAKVAGTPVTERTCAQCGELMVDRVYRSAKYCSPKCMQAAVNAARPPRRVPPVRPGVTCKQCGGEMPAGSKVFCSPQCRWTWDNHKRSAENLAFVIATRRPCKGCGGEIPVGRHGGALFCSPKCKTQFHAAQWRERSPHYMRLYLYGITQEQYEAMLAAQDHRCAICGSAEWPAAKHPGSPCVDHDRTTEEVRGLLCDFCNRGIGMLGHDPVRLEAAAAYLRAYAVRRAAVGAGES